MFRCPPMDCPDIAVTRPSPFLPRDPPVQPMYRIILCPGLDMLNPKRRTSLLEMPLIGTMYFTPPEEALRVSFGVLKCTCCACGASALSSARSFAVVAARCFLRVSLNCCTCPSISRASFRAFVCCQISSSVFVTSSRQLKL